MSLNIKNEEAHRMAKELAGHTGESMTTAVTEAIRERRDRVVGKSKAERFEAIMASSKKTAALLKAKGVTLDHAELLYGEDGLPK
ncbi:MAG: type II toxin-antitoxin system VapB family antitoxin [Solirubrobacterales bacterium]|nr:type II toxin-antitoxin system VapB family antitoxin [Solirubrobacterales bacterium]